MGLLEEVSDCKSPPSILFDPLAHLHGQTPDPKKMQINLTDFLTDYPRLHGRPLELTN
jgi:hypothetical protein